MIASGVEDLKNLTAHPSFELSIDRCIDSSEGTQVPVQRGAVARG